jgi:hypothetical protein
VANGNGLGSVGCGAAELCEKVQIACGTPKFRRPMEMSP